MKIYISYFGQFRNMTPKQICFSTAIWDPKWFHDFRDQSYKFVKDGKIYGLRATCFNSRNHECSGMPCPHSPGFCAFMTHYAKQLEEMDFDEVVKSLTESAETIANELNVQNPEIVLLVHEKPDNPCSERAPLKKWFEAHGMKLHEWRKSSKN